RSARALWIILRKAYYRHALMDISTSRHLCRLCGLSLVPLRLSLPLEYLRRGSSSMSAPHSQGNGAKTLPLERLLGTALVLAVMSTKRLLPQEELENQVALARLQRWRHPPGRGFNWFLRVFQVMAAQNLGTRGWCQRATLWNLVLLQSADGSFRPDGAGDLATVLHAGEPWESPVSSLLLRFSDTAIVDSAPAELLEALGYASGARPELHSLALRVWATILAVARYHTIAFAWCVNPNAPLKKRTYLCNIANAWLEREALDRPALREQLEVLRERGREVVAHWEQEHHKRLLLARTMRIPPRHRLKQPPFHWRLFLQLRQLVRTAMGHHMVLGLHSVQFWDPVSRGARLVLLATNWILMISIAVGIYYSHAMLCCRELKEHLGCESLSTEDACTVDNLNGRNVTFATCGDLLEQAEDFDDFSCKAFPQSTLADSFIMVMYMCTLVIPIRLLLTVLFGMQHSRSIPAHWVVSPRSVKSAFGAPVAGIVQAMVYVMYAVLLSIGKLKKAFIAFFMIVITVMLKPMQRIASAIRGLQRCGRAVTTVCTRTEKFIGKSTSGSIALCLIMPLTAASRCLHKLMFDHSFNTITYGLVIALWLSITYVLMTYEHDCREERARELEAAGSSGWEDGGGTGGWWRGHGPRLWGKWQAGQQVGTVVCSVPGVGTVPAPGSRWGLPYYLLCSALCTGSDGAAAEGAWAISGPRGRHRSSPESGGSMGNPEGLGGIVWTWLRGLSVGECAVGDFPSMMVPKKMWGQFTECVMATLQRIPVDMEDVEADKLFFYSGALCRSSRG
ncbi:hypothetical protein CYMTET_23466, partial [Cymbomonas tetramitiformis]